MSVRQFFSFETNAYQLIQIFPVILGHQTEGAQKRPTKVVVGCVTKVWIRPGLRADVVIVTLTAKNQNRIMVLITETRISFVKKFIPFSL